MYHGFHKIIQQQKLFSTLILIRTIINNWALIIIIDNNWAENWHIRMISEGSYDTEDWSNEWCWKFSFASQK